MLSLARVCFLAVLVSLLFNVSLGQSQSAQLQYSIYNGTTCSGNFITSGVDYDASFSYANGQEVWQGSCISVSGVSGVFSAQLGCSVGSDSQDTAVLFSDSACQSAAFEAVGSGPGQCASVNSQSLSLTVTCYGGAMNGAASMAALSLPLMALLASVAAISA